MEVTKVKSTFLEPFVKSNVFGDWIEPLYPILDTLYFKDLVIGLDKQYAKERLFPDKKKVFHAFRLCKWQDLKVVILGQDPYPNINATGLAFANPENKYISPALRMISRQIEKEFYKGLNLNFDPTLETWAKQGVLLLNTALTSTNIPGSHIKIWKGFTQEVLKTISNQKEGIIFLLWGSYAQGYAQYIQNPNKHHILTYEHPTYAYRQEREWNCSHFKAVNSILEYRKKEIIKW